MQPYPGTVSGNSHSRQADGGHGDLEEEVARRMWPTPTVADTFGTTAMNPRKDANFETHHAVTLAQMVNHVEGLLEEAGLAGLLDEEFSIEALQPQLWPTPNASVANYGEGLETWEARREREKAKHRNGNGFGMPLTIAVQYWPTPTVSRTGNYTQDGRTGHRRLSLQGKANLWPTPTVDDAHNVTRKSGGISSLTREVTNSGAATGRLNPTWVAWLMGFPLDWLDVNSPPSVTRSSHKSPNTSDAASSKRKRR